jgi:hypothetical protein
LVAEFREKTVKKLFIFFTVSNFLKSFFFLLFSLFFSVKKALQKTNIFLKLAFRWKPPKRFSINGCGKVKKGDAAL